LFYIYNIHTHFYLAIGRNFRGGEINIENDGQTTSNMSENDNIHKSIPIDAGQPMTSALESRTSVRRT